MFLCQPFPLWYGEGIRVENNRKRWKEVASRKNRSHGLALRLAVTPIESLAFELWAPVFLGSFEAITPVNHRMCFLDIWSIGKYQLRDRSPSPSTDLWMISSYRERKIFYVRFFGDAALMTIGFLGTFLFTEPIMQCLVSTMSFPSRYLGSWL